MAVDTVAKRKSMLSFGSGDLLLHPDGTIDVGDRLTLLTLYGGIEAEEPAAPPSPRYRPNHAVPPPGYSPGRAAGPDAYRPANPTTPGG